MDILNVFQRVVTTFSQFYINKTLEDELTKKEIDLKLFDDFYFCKNFRSPLSWKKKKKSRYFFL